MENLSTELTILLSKITILFLNLNNNIAVLSEYCVSKTKKKWSIWIMPKRLSSE